MPSTGPKENILYVIHLEHDYDSHAQGDVPVFFAFSLYRNWSSIMRRTRAEAIADGEAHARILEAIYPQLGRLT